MAFQPGNVFPSFRRKLEIIGNPLPLAGEGYEGGDSSVIPANNDYPSHSSTIRLCASVSGDRAQVFNSPFLKVRISSRACWPVMP